MDIINDFTEDEVSFLLDLVHEYYAKDDSVEPLIEKVWMPDHTGDAYDCEITVEEND